MFLRSIKNIHAHVLLSLTMLDITYYHINNDTCIIIINNTHVTNNNTYVINNNITYLQRI